MHVYIDIVILVRQYITFTSYPHLHSSPPPFDRDGHFPFPVSFPSHRFASSVAECGEHAVSTPRAVGARRHTPRPRAVDGVRPRGHTLHRTRSTHTHTRQRRRSLDRREAWGEEMGILAFWLFGFLAFFRFYFKMCLQKMYIGNNRG